MKICENKQIIDACYKLGINIKLFMMEEKAERQYSKYLWAVHPHSDKNVKCNIIIHAIPQPLDAEKPWEEWFVYNGKLCHHLLFLEKRAETKNEIYIVNKDEDHPLITRGHLWHYYKSSDVKPYLFTEQK